MPEGARGSFPCPHCATVYPLQPQLVGRPIRCRQCKAVFQVDAQGTAVPVITNRPATSRHRAPNDDRAAAEAPAPSDTSSNAGHSTRFVHHRQQSGRGGRLAQTMRRSLRSGRFEAGSEADAETGGSDRSAAPSPAESGATNSGTGVFDDAPALDAREAPQKRDRSSSTIFALRRKERRKGPAPDIRAALAEAATAESADASGHPPSTRPQAGPPPTADRSGPTRTTVCPHCRATYPFSRKLIDQVIRCRECRGVFRVFENGLAEPVITNRPSSRESSSREEKSELFLAEPDDTSSMATPAVGYNRKRRSRIMRTKDLIQAMSKDLESLQDEIPAEPIPPQRSPRPPSRAASDLDDLLAAQRKRVVLTDEGRKRLRTLRQVGVLGMLVVALVAWWLASFVLISEERQALYDLVAGASADQAHAVESIRAIRRRAWRSGATVQPVVTCPRADFGRSWFCDLSSLAPVFERLRGHLYHRGIGQWFTVEDYEPVTRLWREHLSAYRPAEQFPAVLAEAGLTGLDHATLYTRVQAAGLPKEAREVLQGILADPGVGSILHRFATTGLPERMEGLTFYGQDGSVILSSGGVLRDQHYRGLLLRFHRDGEPGAWKVFELELVAGP